MVEFEFDPDKSAANEAKHGINFTQAEDLWNDPRPWSAVVTYRDGRIRLISVRRSRDEEVAIYES